MATPALFVASGGIAQLAWFGVSIPGVSQNSGRSDLRGAPVDDRLEVGAGGQGPEGSALVTGQT